MRVRIAVTPEEVVIKSNAVAHDAWQKFPATPQVARVCMDPSLRSGMTESFGMTE
jgi:hypothetical protein